MNDWNEILEPFKNDLQFINMLNWLHEERKYKDMYPAEDEMFTAFQLTSYVDSRVVILGQDPYPGPGLAHGLAFSVKPGSRIPPSLINIFKEIQDEVGGFIPDNGYLVPWAQQGVLLLNTVLTVEAYKSKSHYNIGWQRFTDFIIQRLSDKSGIVFMLWGADAKSKEELIDHTSNLVLKASHPSPLAMGKFFGCGHFVKCNEFLDEFGMKPIDWQIPNLYE